MNKPSLMIYKGNDFELSGRVRRRFVKDVLRVGKWIHPVTKQVVDITPERIRNLVANTEQYRQTLDRKAVPFQDGHNFDAKKTLGWWTRFWTQGDRLYGEVEVTDDDAAEKIEQGSIHSVSARFEPLSDTKGRNYDEAFSHVCATPLAVCDGQQDFVKLSREADPVQLYVEFAGIMPEKEKKMDPKKLAVLLGLPETATPEQIEEATKKATAAEKTALDQVKAEQDRVAALSASLKEHGLEVKEGKAVKLSAAPPADEPAYVKELREKLEKSEKSAQLSRLQDVKAKVEAAAKNMVVPPALVPAFTDLASIETEVQAMCLSADGSTAQKKGINALGRVMEILSGLPKLNAETLQQLSATELDEAEKVKKAAAAKAKTVLARTTGGDAGDE